MEPAEIVQDADFEAAARRGAQRLKQVKVAVAARYEQQAGRAVIELDSSLKIAFRPRHAQRGGERHPIGPERDRLG